MSFSCCYCQWCCLCLPFCTFCCWPILLFCTGDQVQQEFNEDGMHSHVAALLGAPSSLLVVVCISVLCTSVYVYSL
jgi:hypothetical protein